MLPFIFSHTPLIRLAVESNRCGRSIVALEAIVRDDPELRTQHEQSCLLLGRLAGDVVSAAN